MQDIVYQQRVNFFRFQRDTSLWHVPHMHKEIEIIYVNKGGAVAHADTYSAKIADGDLFFAFSNQIHYYENAIDGDYTVMIVSPEIIYGMRGLLMKKAPLSNVVHLNDNPELQHVMENINNPKGDFVETAAVGYLNVLLSGALQGMSFKKSVINENGTLKRVLDYCNDNFTENIDLTTAENEVFLSKYYISRLMKGNLGIGFTDYVQMLRADYAAEALRNTEIKIADISENAGFGTIRSFNRAFKKYYNSSPNDYRKAYSFLKST